MRSPHKFRSLRQSRPVEFTRSTGMRLAVGMLFVALFLFPSDVPAQTPILKELTVEGATTTDVQLIKNVSGLTLDRVVNRDDIQGAVHQVFGLNLFEDVHVEGEEVEDGLRLVIHVKELPRLDKVVFKGNKELKEKDFVHALKHGQPVGPNALAETRRVIKKAYQEKGFFLVEVESELAPTAVSGEVDAVFKIKENKPVKVRKVEIEGNVLVKDGDLVKKMSNKPRGFLRSIFGGGHFNREKYSDDKKAVVDEYRKQGFLDAVVVSDTIILDDERTHVTLDLTVNEGPRYYFGGSTFAQTTVLKEDQLRDVLKYKPGEVFDQEKFEESQQNIYNAYMEEGHLYARVVEEMKTQDTVVNINYDISEGVPAHIHRIDITGNSKTKDKVIRRELAIFPGQVFRRSSLQRSLRNVMLLNYFSNATPEFQQLPDGRVDLSIKVDEKPTGQIQVGGGYSEQDHLVGTINLGIPNLFGGGQSADMMVEFGRRRQSFRLGFTEPWFLDSPTSLGLDVQRLSRSLDDAYSEVVTTGGNVDTAFVLLNQAYVLRTSGFSTRIGRRLRWPDDYFSVYAGYRLEDQKYTDLSTDAKTAIGAGKLDRPIDGLISSASFTIIRDARDLPEFATRGSRISYRVEFAGGALGGDWNYTRHTLNYTVHRSIWKGFVFAPVWNLGLIQSDAAKRTVPPSELYYAGGIRSDGMIRGYDDRSILAIDDAPRTLSSPIARDSSIGALINGRFSGAFGRRGQAIGVMNAQITFPIAKQQIHGLFFFDAGNVWLNASKVDPLDLWTAYGFGFRLAVPGMGTLGFDFGIPLRGPESGHLKPHFQFGGSFY